MILLIRHGATEGNLSRRYIGRTDEGLCAVGVAQAEGLRAALGAWNPAVVYASPMRRCLETAALVFPDAAPVLVDGFREMDFGMLEGHTHRELEHDPRYRAWVESEGRIRVPGGESREAFDARCVGAFRALGLTVGDDAALVCHGGTVMALLAALGERGRGYYDYQLGNAEGFGCEAREDGGLRVVEHFMNAHNKRRPF